MQEGQGAATATDPDYFYVDSAGICYSTCDRHIVPASNRVEEDRLHDSESLLVYCS